MNKVVKGLGIGCVSIVALFIITLVVIAVAFPDSKTESSKELVKEEGQSEVKEEAKKFKWAYDSGESKMGEAYKVAQVVSDDILDFKFPYQGGSTSTLTIRKQKGAVDIYYQISKGQIVSINPIKGGTVRVKFDDEKPMTVEANEPSDYSSDFIFLGSTSKLVSKLKTSKKMILEVEFYDEGARQIEFNVEGLEW